MKISAVNSPPLKAEQKTTVLKYAAAANDPATITDDKPKDLEKIIEKMNQDAEAANREVRFALNEATHRIVVEVVDKVTSEVVATFPPKQILDMMAAFAEEAKAGRKAETTATVQSVRHKA